MPVWQRHTDSNYHWHHAQPQDYVIMCLLYRIVVVVVAIIIIIITVETLLGSMGSFMNCLSDTLAGH